MSKRALILTSIFLVFTVSIFAALYVGYFLVSPAGVDTQEEVFLVKKGSGLRSIAGELKIKGLIKSKNLFILWAVLKGDSRDIKAGEYSLNKAMAPVKIFHLMTCGAVKTYHFTIPEGLTIQQIGEILTGKGFVDQEEFNSLISDKALAASYHIDGPNLEGYLFPDTYVISRDMGARAIIELMINRFWDVFNPLAENRHASLSAKEIITLASIVEKETGLPEERPLIASVFLNRLKRRMRLESDPTVIYGLNDFDGNLKRRDLHTASPYNTYNHYGLPPGPIANPGKESLVAVLNPAQTDFLYFVSKNDGSHHFSSTLSEHNRAVTRYQKKGRSGSRRKIKRTFFTKKEG